MMTSQARGAAIEVAKTAVHAVHCVCAKSQPQPLPVKNIFNPGHQKRHEDHSADLPLFSASAERHDELSTILKASTTTGRSTFD